MLHTGQGIRRNPFPCARLRTIRLSNQLRVWRSKASETGGQDAVGVLGSVNWGRTERVLSLFFLLQFVWWSGVWEWRAKGVNLNRRYVVSAYMMLLPVLRNAIIHQEILISSTTNGEVEERVKLRYWSCIGIISNFCLPLPRLLSNQANSNRRLLPRCYMYGRCRIVLFQIISVFHYVRIL